ncbi:MAG: Universal stress protein family protein [Chloroflexi bacterium]|jgi:nucleotide-binding universal stress UspA family protein|nr:MAG: Universal stress protein family protein [Chloroflexota bacterium]
MILAIITGSTSDEYVATTASRLAKQTKLPINLLYVIEVDRNYPIDMEIPEDTEKGEKALFQIEKITSKFKVKSKGEILQARFSGSAIISQSENIQAKLIVLAHKKQKSNNLYDNICEYVTDNAKCDVIMCANLGKQALGNK